MLNLVSMMSIDRLWVLTNSLELCSFSTLSSSGHLAKLDYETVILA